MSRAIPWCDPKTGAIFVGILDMGMVLSPAITYMFAYMFWTDGMLRNIDPYNVFTDPDHVENPDAIFVLVYYFPPAGYALILGCIILMSAFLESLVMMIIVVGLTMILIIGSSCIILLMLVYMITWFLILPLLIPTALQLYYLWILCDYRDYLHQLKMETYKYAQNDEDEEKGEKSAAVENPEPEADEPPPEPEGPPPEDD